MTSLWLCQNQSHPIALTKVNISGGKQDDLHADHHTPDSKIICLTALYIFQEFLYSLVHWGLCVSVSRQVIGKRKLGVMDKRSVWALYRFSFCFSLVDAPIG